MRNDTSKMKVVLAVLNKNKLLFLWILAGLTVTYTKNNDFTWLNILVSVFISIMLYGILVWGFKKR